MFLKKITAFLLAAAVIAGSFSGCNQKNNGIARPVKATESGSDENWETVTDKTVTIKNGNIVFEFDTETTHFSVRNTLQNTVYTSVPEGVDAYGSSEEYSRLNSEITVRYYGQQTTEQYMFSYDDCVQNENYTVKTNGEKIRVYYTLGEKSGFVPSVFTEEEFAKVLEKLGSASLKRRFEKYYDLYSKDDKPADFNQKSEKYPLLSKMNLYIINDMTSDVEREGISEYLADIAYTSEEYQAFASSVGLTQTDEPESVGFVIPVEYSLNSDGFNARVLSDKIVEFSKEFKLQLIDFLQYFAATPINTKGEFVLPDGSGAVIAFNSEKGAFNAPYYGEDYSVSKEKEESLDKNLNLPVYGIDFNDSGILAIIESGSEIAELTVSPANQVIGFNFAFLTFNYLSIDVTDYGADVDIPIYNLFSKERSPASPCVRYILLEKDKSDYISMAKVFREYLSDKKILKPYTEETPIYIDYICMVTKPASMMGIPYTQKIVLSTIEDIKQSVQKIIAADIGPCVVRLLGYSPSGMENKAYTKLEIDSRVGTKKQLEELNGILTASGGKLYLDADVQFAYKKGNGFSPQNDASRYLNRLQVYRGFYDVVTRKYYTDSLPRYFVSPLRYQEYTKSFLNSLTKKSNGLSTVGLSYGNFGRYLGGDYAKNNDVDRFESAALIASALEYISAENKNILFDSGNYYILKYAGGILNSSVNYSAFESETEKIPFYQTVIKGSIPYAGMPDNMMDNSEKEYLNNIAFGAAPYAAFITKDDILLTNTQYESVWYSLSEKNRIDEFIEKTKSEYEVRKKISGAYITASEAYGNGVTKTVYSNNQTVFVNSGDAGVKIGERLLPSGEYIIVGG